MIKIDMTPYTTQDAMKLGSYKLLRELALQSKNPEQFLKNCNLSAQVIQEIMAIKIIYNFS